jgi:CPA2 family monovalent cation:H+ antiporter-2
MSADLGLLKDLAIIMTLAGAALVVFRRLGQPPVLAYLLAGLIVGPFVLPTVSLADTESIRALADLGLVFLLFALGLEFGWERIRQVGLRVILIGLVEISFMVALGYELGLLMNWSGTEALFLGAALAISSSAVLVKVLRDSNQLFSAHGRLIVGILVVEDFAAVLLLSILSGVATTGAATLHDTGLLVGKLGLFALSVIIIGSLVAPRLIRFVGRFQSKEVLLVTGLGLCFGLALVANELGISAAAGAFLIGTVLGDTESASSLQETMSPIRDMFAALFFVSIGMLVDVSLLAKFIGPALLITWVFVAGKIVVNTLATFFVGQGGRTSLAVGMGMPQTGEFSLAMVKVGADHGVVGAFVYPVVAITTAVTSFLYPFIFRSTEKVASFLEQRSPRLLRQHADNLTMSLTALRSAFGPKGEAASRLQHETKILLVNMGIITVIFAVGTYAFRYTGNLADLLPGIRESIVGLGLGIGVLVLSVPSAWIIWRQLQELTEELTAYLFQRRPLSARLWTRQDLRVFVRDSILAAMLVLAIVLTVPIVSHMLLLGSFSIPLPILLVGGFAFVTARSLFRIHGMLERVFSRTLLGEQEGRPERDSSPQWDVEEQEGE